MAGSARDQARVHIGSEYRRSLLTESTIARVSREMKFTGKLDIPIGTMIEIPRSIDLFTPHGGKQRFPRVLFCPYGCITASAVVPSGCHPVPAGFIARHLAPEIILISGREGGMGIRASDQAELEGIGPCGIATSARISLAHT